MWAAVRGPVVAGALAVALSAAACTNPGTSLSDPRPPRPQVTTTPQTPQATTPQTEATTSAELGQGRSGMPTRSVESGSNPSGSSTVSANPPPPTPRRVRFVEWVLALGVAGGADDPHESALALLAKGSCAEARAVAQDQDQPLPAFYDAAAAACLAALNGRHELWAYAEAVAARPLQPNDCIDRAVTTLLRRLVDIHRQQPAAQLRPKPARPGDTVPCPRMLQVFPEHGPPQGGYPLRLVGVHLPPVVVIHFTQYVGFQLQDIRITTRSTEGGTKAVITVPSRRTGADREVSIYPAGWPFGPINTPLFIYDEPSPTRSAPPPTPSSRQPTASPATRDSPTVSRTR
jgi:hypothetical protein